MMFQTGHEITLALLVADVWSILLTRRFYSKIALPYWPLSICLIWRTFLGQELKKSRPAILCSLARDIDGKRRLRSHRQTVYSEADG